MPHAWDESLRLRTTPYNTASPSLLSENWKFTAASRSFNAGASLSGEGTFSRSNRFYKQEPTTGKMLTLPSTFSRAMKRPKTGVGSFGAVSRLVQAGPRQESSWNTNLEVIPGPQARYEPNQCVPGTFAHLTRKSKKLEIETAKSNLHSLRRRRKVLLNKVGGASNDAKAIRSLTKRIKLLQKRKKVTKKNMLKGLSFDNRIKVILSRDNTLKPLQKPRHVNTFFRVASVADARFDYVFKFISLGKMLRMIYTEKVQT